MDLRNWEFSVTGSAISGADVYVRDAVLTHPNTGSILSSTSTDANGMWAFTGLTETPKDVSVVYNGRTKWYKGMSRHSTGVTFADEGLTADYIQLVGQGSAPSDPAAGVGRLWFDTADGDLKFKYGGSTIVELASFEGATGILRASGWGSLVNADVDASAAIDPLKLGADAYVECTDNANQAVANNTITDLTWNTEVEDTFGIHAASSANFVIPTGYDGLWVVVFSAAWASAAGGTRQLQVYRNGSSVSPAAGAPMSALAYSGCSALFRAAAGDTIKGIAYQDSGGSVTVQNASAAAKWFMGRLGK